MDEKNELIFWKLSPIQMQIVNDIIIEFKLDWI
jgi:hypothetical protein